MVLSQRRRGPCRLLIVENDQHLIDQLRRLFASTPFECEVARSLRTAEAILAERRIDVVAVDATLESLPRGGVPVLIQGLKARAPSMKVVIFNGITGKASQRRLRRMGADGYLSKRCGLEALERSARRLM